MSADGLLREPEPDRAHKLAAALLGVSATCALGGVVLGYGWMVIVGTYLAIGPLAFLALLGPARHGFVLHHLAMMGIGLILGVGVVWYFDPHSDVVLSFPFEHWWPENALSAWRTFLASLIGQRPSGRILTEWTGITYEALNLAAALSYVVLAGLLALWAPAGGGGKDRWPSLHNPTTRLGMANLVIALSVLMAMWGLANWQLDREMWLPGGFELSWHRAALAFPWVAFLLPSLHLCALAMRPDLSPSVPAEYIGAAKRAEPSPSVRGLFDELTGDSRLQPALALKGWSAPGSGGGATAAADVFSQVRAALDQGDKVLLHGPADEVTYGLLTDAILRVQDGGRTSMLLCPDGAAGRIWTAMSWASRDYFPEITQRNIRFAAGTHWAAAFDARTAYDVLLIEERQLLDAVVPHRTDLAHSLQRLGLVAVVDLHLLDACSLRSAIEDLDLTARGRDVAVLCVGRDRHGLAEQIDEVFGRVSSSRQPRDLGHVGGERGAVGLICWRDGSGLIDTLGDAVGLAPRAWGETLPLLGLRATGDMPAVVYDPMRQTLAAAWDGLARALPLGVETTARQRLARIKRVSHLAPDRLARVILVQDAGNVADACHELALYGDPEQDRLVQVLSPAYPGRDFLYAHLDLAAPTTSLARPIAQKPGAGVSEVAPRIAKALQDPKGLEQRRLDGLLDRLAGGLRTDLGLTATRTGLARLFGLVDPEFHADAVVSETAANHAEQFFLKQGRIIGGLLNRSPVVKDGATIDYLSPRDEGLTFHRDSILRLGSESFLIERIDAHPSRVTVSAWQPGGQKAAPRYHYRRRYRVRLDLAYACEQLRREGELDSRPRLERRHLHATIERRTTGVIEWPIDQPIGPVPRPGTRQIGLQIEVVRPLRSLYLVALYPECPPLSSEMRRSVATTLAMSLQDTLGIKFPALAGRIVAACLGTPAAEGSLAHFYPMAELCEPPSAPRAADDGGDVFDFVIIEDDDHDLGVARAVHDRWEVLLEAWHAYLRYRAQNSPWSADGGPEQAAQTCLPLVS